MSNENLLERKSAVYQMGLLFNQAPSDEKITAYANALMAFTPKQIIYAFNQVIYSGSPFFPALSEVLKHLSPNVETKEDRAPIIVKEIIRFIKMWHPDLEKEHIHELSSDAQLVFQVIGHTADLRNSESFEIMNAQIERLVKGVLASKTNDVKNERLERLGISTGKVLNFKTMDFSGYLPSDIA